MEAVIVATARTYNDTGSGTYGQYIPAVTLAETAALGSRPLQLLQVEESGRIRTNVGVTEVAGKPAALEITVVPPNSKVEAKVQVDLGATYSINRVALNWEAAYGKTYQIQVSTDSVNWTTIKSQSSDSLGTWLTTR